MTLDGKIAPPPGDAQAEPGLGSLAPSGGWITSEVARAHVHEMRHANDAIMVGVGTVIADDPLLTDRTGLAPAPAAAARDSRFAPASAAGIARGEDRARRSDRLLLLRRGEQAA